LKKATDLKFGLSERRGTLVDMPIMFIGLGDDKNVTAEEGQSLLKELGAFGYIEFSETDTENFEKMLSSLSLGIITNYQNALKRSPRKFRFKVVVVGDANVGKTSLIQRFIKGSFDKDFVKTTGAQVSEHVVGMRGVKIMSLFWDIASAEIQKITEARQERIGLEIPQTKVEEDPNLLMQINEYLRSKLARAGFASVDVQKTSLGHRITIWANRPGIVIGKEGKRIQEITDVLQERFGLEMPQIEVDVIPGFFQNSTAAIIVCNLEEDNLGKDSLKQVSFWHNEIIKYCGNIPIVVIANKVDLIDEHKITKSKFQEFVNEKKILGYYIISVKTGQGVDEAFTRIIEALSDKIK
jgi:GTPase SAR1 family protein